VCLIGQDDSVRPGLLVTLAVLLIGTGCGRSGRDAYVQRNGRLLSDVPQFPGAREAARKVSSYVGSTTGYETVLAYEVGGRTKPRRVVDFYARELPSWQQYETSTGCLLVETADLCGSVPEVWFRHGQAVVQLGFSMWIEEPFAPMKTFLLTVDSRGARRFDFGLLDRVR
jgi:hypothetical protein